jgi:23S rRNA (cytidine1920-2'-O)/16S rRNA (cytidine1409-2'-O)-methyltransferase
LDLLVLDRGLFSSRQAAVAAIMDGAVLVNGEKITKPGKNIDVFAQVELIPSFKEQQFVSRGGLKLNAAMSQFAIVVKDRICLDIGASTGGFTDCLLQHGAKKVYAVDVGYGQIDWRLRNDQRVIVKERQNARYLTRQILYGSDDPVATLATIDVSFISLKVILPACCRLLEAGQTEIICLIKPQFEVGRNQVGKGGVVNSADAHVVVIKQLLEAIGKLDLAVCGLTHSPLVGPAGNLEFLIHLTDHAADIDTPISIEAVVERAHRELLAPKRK